MKSTIPNKKRGSILVIVMVIVVTVTLLVAVMLRLGSFSQIETVKQLRNTQAHWIAEAGLERALSWVMASGTYRSALGDEPNSFSSPYSELPNGEYALKVWQDSPTTDDKIIIQSRGTTTIGGDSQSETVQLTINYRPGPSGAIIGLNSPGQTHLDSDVTVFPYPNGDGTFIPGNIYRDGDMEIDGEIVEPSTVHATENLTGDGTYTEASHMPAPEPPTIDPDGTFSTFIFEADAQSNTTFNGTLSGTVYINGDYTLNGSISGSGTLVVSGDLEFNGNNATIDDNVDVVVGGNIEISKHTTFRDNVEIFSQDGNISINHDIDGGSVAFIAQNGSLGHIETDYNNNLGSIDTSGLLSSGHTVGKVGKSSLTALFYAAYDVIFEQKANIYGSIIAGRHVDLGKGTGNAWNLHYDPSVYQGWNLSYPNDITLTNSIWEIL